MEPSVSDRRRSSRAGLGWHWLLAIGGLLSLLGVALIIGIFRTEPAAPGAPSGVTEYHDAVPLPEFALRGPRGAFSNTHLTGRWSFVFFGYTQCPDVCPTALTLMKDVRAILGTAPTAPPFQVVFVSVDPRRDTDELLQQYLAAFDPSFIGITGDDDALLPLAKTLGVYYRRNDGTDVQRYTVDHSATIFLVNPRGRMVAVFSPPQIVANVAASYRRIAQEQPRS